LRILSSFESASLKCKTFPEASSRSSATCWPPDLRHNKTNIHPPKPTTRRRRWSDLLCQPAGCKALRIHKYESGLLPLSSSHTARRRRDAASCACPRQFQPTCKASPGICHPGPDPGSQGSTKLGSDRGRPSSPPPGTSPRDAREQRTPSLRRWLRSVSPSAAISLLNFSLQP